MTIRKLSTIILIAILSSFVTLHSAYASDYTNRTLFLANFDGESNQFFGAVYSSDDTWTAIAWERADGAQAQEDDLQNDTSQFIVDWNLDERDQTFVRNNIVWTWRLLVADSTVDNVNTHDGFTDGNVNGVYAQFDNGAVTNGSIYLLREANPYTSADARGWFVQNGMLHSYVSGVIEEENPVNLDHKVYVALVIL